MPQKKLISGTRLPEDWKPSADLLAWAKGERPDMSDDDLRFMTEDFVDYWVSLPDSSKARKTDWTRTFKRWTRQFRLPNHRKYPAKTNMPSHSEVVL